MKKKQLIIATNNTTLRSHVVKKETCCHCTRFTTPSRREKWQW